MDFFKSSLDSGFKKVGLGAAIGLKEDRLRLREVVDRGLTELQRSMLVGVLLSVSIDPNSPVLRRLGNDVAAFLLGVI